VQYFLAEMTLRGTPLCYVQQVAGELHIEEKRAKSAVNDMVEETVVEWVVPGRNFQARSSLSGRSLRAEECRHSAHTGLWPMKCYQGSESNKSLEKRSWHLNGPESIPC
jgi:hypothetical protein